MAAVTEVLHTLTVTFVEHREHVLDLEPATLRVIVRDLVDAFAANARERGDAHAFMCVTGCAGPLDARVIEGDAGGLWLRLPVPDLSRMTPRRHVLLWELAEATVLRYRSGLMPWRDHDHERARP